MNESSPASIRVHAPTDHTADVEELAALHGGTVGLDIVLDDLTHTLGHSWRWGRAVETSYKWEPDDNRDPEWWPQGISTSADAGFHPAGERWAQRPLLMVSWYSKKAGGSRLSILDREAERYQHILLGRAGRTKGGDPTWRPLKVHAGGICWIGSWLFIAATARGFHVAHVDDIIQMAEYGHSYVLPIRYSYRASSDDTTDPLRFSFMSLEREASSLLIGEYGRSRDHTTRVAHLEINRATGLPITGEDDLAVPISVAGDGPVRAQGGVRVDGDYYLTTSLGPVFPGTVRTGHLGGLRRRPWAVPIGPEDLCHEPDDDMFWTVTEHPRRRWICGMPRRWFL